MQGIPTGIWDCIYTKSYIHIYFIQILTQTQGLLVDLHGKYCVLHKRNKLLEVQKPTGRKKCGNMIDKELALAMKADGVRLYGRKYSVTHCLWINSEIFPLSENPRIDLNGQECWLSAHSMEDGVKMELFAFVPRTDWPLMAHKNFGGDVSSVLILCSNDFLQRASSPKELVAFVLRWSLTLRQPLEPSLVFPPNSLFVTSHENLKLSAVRCLLTHTANTRSSHQYYFLIPEICIQRRSSNLQHSSR